MKMKKRIGVALGESPADILLKNAKVVSVLSGRIWKTDIAISEKYIVGFGRYKAKKVIDLKGLYVSSGLFDAHMHMESSFLTPAEFAKAVVPLGTTAVVIDPHEIANVMGLDGIYYMLKASRNLPLDVYIMLPSCVPSSSLDHSASKLLAEDLEILSSQKRVLGLGEVMDIKGVLEKDDEVIDKLNIDNLIRIDGHAPGLSGKELNAYCLGNIRSDHECTSRKEALEKLNAGLHIMIREGSCARNLEDLLPIVTPISARRCLFCTDDREPEDIINEGHVNYIVKKAVRLGLDPIIALMIASANAADYFRLPKKQGAVAAGYKADLIIFDNLKKLNIRKVIKNGKLVAEDGEMVVPIKGTNPVLRGSVNVGNFEKGDLNLSTSKKKANVIELIPGQIYTKRRLMSVAKQGREVVSDTKRDILKLAVIERHHASGNVGVGLVKGFGIKRGAIASSVSHDSHNIISVGVSDADMFTAVEKIIEYHGGMVVVLNGQVIASLPLDIAGLMSSNTLENVVSKNVELKNGVRKLGCKIKNPFQALSFLALSVIPEVKLTDRGVVDVKKQKYISLFR